jgi:PPOX class probable F420-dependent enzyme
MRWMDPSEIRDFMRSGSRTGKLASVNADGSAHVKPIWFDFDDATGDLMFMTWHGSIAAENMRRDARVSILVDDEHMPFAWARADGVASFSEDPGDRLRWATDTCRRYVGEGLAETFGRRNGVEGELVVRVRLSKLTGQAEMAV